MDLEQETSIDSQAPKRARPLHIFLYVLAGLFFAITLLVSLVVTYLNAPTDYDLPTTFPALTNPFAILAPYPAARLFLLILRANM